jgi:hypothetical protein
MVYFGNFSKMLFGSTAQCPLRTQEYEGAVNQSTEVLTKVKKINKALVEKPLSYDPLRDTTKQRLAVAIADSILKPDVSVLVFPKSATGE